MDRQTERPLAQPRGLVGRSHRHAHGTRATRRAQRRARTLYSTRMPDGLMGPAPTVQSAVPRLARSLTSCCADAYPRTSSCVSISSKRCSDHTNLHGNPRAGFPSREEIRAAGPPGLEVHYDGMGGGRTNHLQ